MQRHSFTPASSQEGMWVPTEHGSTGERPLKILPRSSGKGVVHLREISTKDGFVPLELPENVGQRANSSNVLTCQRSCQPCVILQALPGYVNVHSGFKDGFPIVDGLHGGNFLSLLLWEAQDRDNTLEKPGAELHKKTAASQAHKSQTRSCHEKWSSPKGTFPTPVYQFSHGDWVQVNAKGKASGVHCWSSLV